MACVSAVAVALWAVVGARLFLGHGQAAGSAAALRLTGSRPVDDSVAAMAFTPDGRTLAVQLGSGVVQLRDPATGAVRASVRPARASADDTGSLAVSPDGKLIAVGVSPGTSISSAVDLISAATGRVTATIPVASPVVHSVAFSPDGKTLAIGAGRNLFLLNLASRASIDVATAQGEFTGDSYYVSYSANGRSLAVASNTGLVRLWNVATTGFTASMTVPSAEGAFVQALAVSPDGRTVALSGSLDDEVGGTSFSAPATWLWSPAAGHLRQLRMPALRGSIAGETETQAFRPDGKLLATGDDQGTVRLWNTATGRLAATEHAPSAISPVTAATFAPDGTALATAQSSSAPPADGTATIQLWTLPHPAGRAQAADGGTAWAWPAGSSGKGLRALRPGVYQVERRLGLQGSWAVTLESIQVAADGQATFVVAVENTGTVVGQVSCTGASAPSGASITLATGQVTNSTAAYCPGDEGPAAIPVFPQQVLRSDAVFASSRGLGRPFAFYLDGPSGLGGGAERITLPALAAAPSGRQHGTAPGSGPAYRVTQHVISQSHPAPEAYQVQAQYPVVAGLANAAVQRRVNAALSQPAEQAVSGFAKQSGPCPVQGAPVSTCGSIDVTDTVYRAGRLLSVKYLSEVHFSGAGDSSYVLAAVTIRVDTGAVLDPAAILTPAALTASSRLRLATELQAQTGISTCDTMEGWPGLAGIPPALTSVNAPGSADVVVNVTAAGLQFSFADNALSPTICRPVGVLPLSTLAGLVSPSVVALSGS